MEVSDVRRMVRTAIDHARTRAAERRARADEAGRDYAVFLSHIAVPLFRQIANALKVEGYSFTVFTPGGGVRLMSDRSADDFIELALDTTGEQPAVVAHVKRARGGRVIELERIVAACPVRDIDESTLLAFVVTELEPFVEK